MELVQDVCTRLDCLALYQVSRTCRAFRHLLQKKPASRHSFFLWRTLTVVHNQDTLNSTNKSDDASRGNLYRLVCFLIMCGLQSQVDVLMLDGCSFLDSPLLDTLIRAFGTSTRLSLVRCPQIDCWQILHLLKSAIKSNQHYSDQRNDTIPSNQLLAALKKIRQPPSPKSGLLHKADVTETNTATLFSLTTETPSSPLPCLQHLVQLDIEGAFPSERSYKSYGHEMYCFGEIRRALLQLGHKDNSNDDSSSNNDGYQQLSEGHYALYQFWLLLRSHMLRWDEEDGGERARTTDLHPPWLPDTLVQFIQITEQDTKDPSSSLIQLDLAPCPLCHRNVATTGRPSSCSTCHAPVMMVCAQCRCHSCHAVLCTHCHHTQQTRSRQQPASTIPVTEDLALWRVIRCQQCHLPRRTCGPCESKHHRWICTTCQQRCHRKLSLSPRLFKKSRHWSHWI